MSTTQITTQMIQVTSKIQLCGNSGQGVNALEHDLSGIELKLFPDEHNAYCYTHDFKLPVRSSCVIVFGQGATEVKLHPRGQELGPFPDKHNAYCYTNDLELPEIQLCGNFWTGCDRAEASPEWERAGAFPGVAQQRLLLKNI